MNNTNTPETDALVTKLTEVFSEYAKGKLYIEDVHVNLIHLVSSFKGMERARNDFRDALKQIKANPGWQDNEVGFMSGHIAHGVLTLHPENL